MIDITKLIEKELLRQQEEGKKRERSGKFSPSKMGRCLRYQIWSRMNEPETNLPNIDALKRFAVGNVIHTYVQNLFDPKCVEVLIETEDIKGYIDICLVDEVQDIKSVSDWAFKYIKTKDFDVNKEKPDNCMQTALYADVKNKPKASLFFINTKSLGSVQCEVDLDKWIPIVRKELETLRGYWSKKELPPALPRCYNGKECSYCSFLQKCNQLEGKI
jgi:hypothetical protein